MPNATARANARTLPIRRRPLLPSLRRRVEAAIENIIGLLDELDGDADLEDSPDTEDDPAELGIADDEGLREQCVGEPSLGATIDIDQRVAWGADRLSCTLDGEATGTEEDLRRIKPEEDRQADRRAAAAMRDRARQIARRQRASVHA